MDIKNLDINNIQFGPEYINDNNDKIIKVIPIRSCNNKALYINVNTPYIKSLCCIYNKNHNRYYFSFRGYLNNLNVLLETLKTNLINKLKYITHISKDLPIRLKFSAYNKNNIFPNLLQFNNKTLSISYDMLMNIINNTKYRISLHIKSICITPQNGYFNIQLSRIILDSIDTLNMTEKLYIYNNINTLSYISFNTLQKLNDIPAKKYKTKRTIKNELYKMI